MAKDDLRYQRTERHLMDALQQALSERPLAKVTVTSLAQAAEINKATFYLHYHDVYELAEAHVRNQAAQAARRMDKAGASPAEPKTFVRWFVDDFSSHREYGRQLARDRLFHVFSDAFIEEMHARMERDDKSQRDVHKDIVMTFLVEGLLGLLPRFGDAYRDELVETATGLLDALKANLPENAFGEVAH